MRPQSRCVARKSSLSKRSAIEAASPALAGSQGYLPVDNLGYKPEHIVRGNRTGKSRDYREDIAACSSHASAALCSPKYRLVSKCDGRLPVAIVVGPIHRDDDFLVRADRIGNSVGEAVPDINAMVTQQPINLLDRVLRHQASRQGQCLTDHRRPRATRWS